MKQQTIKIKTEYIRLDQLLKMSSSVGSGGQAKLVIQDGLVIVNDIVCKQRGKKLRSGDRVLYDGIIYEVSCED